MRSTLMPEKTLNDLFLTTLKDVYYAEKAILRTLPKMAKAAESEDLKDTFLTHRDETAGHVERLEQVFDILGKKASGKTCEAIKGIIEEGQEIMEDFQESDALKRRSHRRRTGDRALRDLALRHLAHVGAAAWDARCGKAP